MKIVSIGEVLWDVIGDQEHLGGAPLNFAVHAGRLGHEVHFISAVGNDVRGDRVLVRMARMNLSSRFVRRAAGLPTGIASVTLDAAGQPTFQIQRPAAYDFPVLTSADIEEILSPVPDWICFGTLLQMSPQAREVTDRLLAIECGARRFYDVNLRPFCYEAELVRDLMSQATVVKLNDEEVSLVDVMWGESHSSLEGFYRDYAARLGLEAVCVTRGAGGCALLLGSDYVSAPGYPVGVVDTVGAGDAFAAAFVHGLGSGWTAGEVADFANRVGSVVAGRAGAIPSWTMDDIRMLGK